MPNPNNCETCAWRQDRDKGDWCYMFHQEPNDVCLQHTGRKPVVYHPRVGPFPAIVALDFEAAELLIQAFRAQHPELSFRLEALASQYTRLSETAALAALNIKSLNHKLPREDKRVRTSAKTGATWPKPKGGY